MPCFLTEIFRPGALFRLWLQLQYRQCAVRRHLPLAAEGRLISAIAITEPQTGSDVSSLRTRAVRDGDGWVINGQKSWITWGADAQRGVGFLLRGTGGVIG
ncbi:acyl-CoA dehydrogenase family protein [Paracoccus mutanolyticus]|uniref:acyl-CoA dehydrogenase family protein n=1 Tax=Paracoccus mutanolyticus TaxID=1499308 RepID=UPI001CB8A318|nr:acyl-CoA dehydrogenase family protein [Paracoccus mutanolyticus]